MPILSNISNIPDRFIPQRSRLDFELSNYKLTKEDLFLKYEKPLHMFDQKPEDYYKRNYLKVLWSTLYRKNSKVISWDDNKMDHCHNYEWPVHPRKKPLIKSPELILDLPSLNSDLYNNAMDWGKNGHLASIFYNRVYLWYCTSTARQNTQEIIKTKLTARKALKWDHSGYNLAVATQNFIKIWSFQVDKLVAQRRCKCFVITESNCLITSICWSSDDKLLATGCSYGTVTVWTNQLEKCTQVMHSPCRCIKSLCLSPDDRTLCSVSFDYTVKVWRWPTLEGILWLSSEKHTLTVEYHPWNSSLLAVGGAELSLWNINLPKRLDTINYSSYSHVDCLTWNPLTAELVVSHAVRSGYGEPSYEDETNEIKLTVLSNLGKAVDTMVKHTDPILYLKWNPDYTELASGSVDESLCIWNFFGSQVRKYKKKYSALINQKTNSSQTLSLYKSIR